MRIPTQNCRLQMVDKLVKYRAIGTTYRYRIQTASRQPGGLPPLPFLFLIFFKGWWYGRECMSQHMVRGMLCLWQPEQN